MNRIAAKKSVFLLLMIFTVPFVTAACDDDDPVVDTATDDTVYDGIYDEEYGLYEGDEFAELESAAYVGRTVTLNADVNRIIEPGKAFLTGDDFVENGLLVVIPPKVTDAPALAEGDDVLVVGKVIDFVSTDIETAYEPFDLDDSLYGDWDDANAILAQTIIKVSPEAVDAPAAPTTSTTMGGDTTTTTAPATTSTTGATTTTTGATTTTS